MNVTWLLQLIKCQFILYILSAVEENRFFSSYNYCGSDQVDVRCWFILCGDWYIIYVERSPGDVTEL